jgi:hypothetical protein
MIYTILREVRLLEAGSETVRLVLGDGMVEGMEDGLVVAGWLYAWTWVQNAKIDRDSSESIGCFSMRLAQTKCSNTSSVSK